MQLRKSGGKSKRRLRRNSTGTRRFEDLLTFPIISRQIRTAASLSVVQSSKKHKDPPTRRSTSTRHEYVAVFTTAQNILFSTREPRPRGARDAPQHIASQRFPLSLPVPLVYRKQLEGERLILQICQVSLILSMFS